MAAFGVTTPTISIILSVFMGGMALGSWAAGKLTSRVDNTSGAQALRLYACAELLIGLSPVVVPGLLKLGQALLAGSERNIEWASSSPAMVEMPSARSLRSCRKPQRRYIGAKY